MVIFYYNLLFKLKFAINYMADFITLEVSKREEGYSVENVNAKPGFGLKSCSDFGEVYDNFLFYHETHPDNKIKLGRGSDHSLNKTQIRNLEVLLDMHNQLMEIKETFKKRETN